MFMIALYKTGQTLVEDFVLGYDTLLYPRKTELLATLSQKCKILHGCS